MRISDWSSDVCSSDLSLSAAALSANGQATDFANFDFAGGTRYPELATASVGPAFYRPGSTGAYVPTPLDRPPPNPVIATSEERRAGKAWVSTCSYRWAPYY